MNNSKPVDYKWNKEQFNENLDKNRNKKKKNKLKSNQQTFYKSGQVKETNLQPCNSIRMDHTTNGSSNDEVIIKECRKKKDPTKLSDKKEDVENNYENSPKIKFKNHSIEVKKYGIEEIKPSVLKNRIAKQSEKQISERSENNNHTVYNDNFDYYAKHKKPKRKEFGKNEYNKFLYNKQSESKPIKERLKKQTRVSKIVNNNYKKNQHSSSNYCKPLNHYEEPHDSKVNHDGFKTMVINRETKNTRSNNDQCKKEPLQNYQRQNNTNNHDKHKWSSCSHSNQNTYNTNNKASFKTENLRKNKPMKNTIESFHVNNNKKIVENVMKCDQKITKRKDIKRRVINLTKSLFDSRFIDNHEQIQNNKNKTTMYESSVKTFTQTFNNQNYLNANDEELSFCDRRQIEDNFFKEYDLKCVNSIKNILEENIIRPTQIYSDYDNNHKYFDNTEIDENTRNYSYTQTIHVANYDRYVEYFNEIWKRVIQTISGL